MKVTDLRGKAPALKRWAEIKVGEVVLHYYLGTLTKNVYYLKLESGDAANLTTGGVGPKMTMENSDRGYQLIKTELLITE